MSIIIQTKCPNCSEYVDFETKQPRHILRFFYQSKQGSFRCAACSLILDDEVALIELHNSIGLLIHVRNE